jgi:hypothetical protein
MSSVAFWQIEVFLSLKVENFQCVPLVRIPVHANWSEQAAWFPSFAALQKYY